MQGSDAENLLSQFRSHRKLIMDLLRYLDQDQLAVKPLNSAGSFGKQFRHILDIEKCYVESMYNGYLTFFRRNIDHSLEMDKARLIHELVSEDNKLEEIIEKLSKEKTHEKYIDCSAVVTYLGNENIKSSPVQVLSWMTEHEILHEGELVLYIRTAGLKFPPSWIIWGLR